MKFIGGVVRYEDGVKTTEGDQFSPTRKVACELNFSLDEGDGDDLIQSALDKAQAFVNGKLGLKVPTAAVRTGRVAAEATAPKTAEPEPVKAQGPKRRTKADLAAEAGLPAKADADPAADPDELVTPEPKKAPPADELDDLLSGEEKPVEITDADMNSAVQKRAGKFREASDDKGNVKIRELVATYNPEPDKQFVLRQIPQADRAGFLKKLEALK